jgi:hypothetical protein
MPMVHCQSAHGTAHHVSARPARLGWLPCCRQSDSGKLEVFEGKCSTTFSLYGTTLDSRRGGQEVRSPRHGGRGGGKRGQQEGQLAPRQR